MAAAVVERSAPYEELRNRKLEENKKKLEELKLGHLSAALKDANNTPKKSPAKQMKRKFQQEGDFIAFRRSSRIANLPEPNYREQVNSDALEQPRTRRFVKRRDLSGRVYASDEARLYAQTKAEEVESKLDPQYPCLIKPMLQSHTTGGFWLGLPIQFCNRNLPRRDTTITLVDENDEEFETTYLAHKKGLSAGWRGFSIYHELVDGDALVFQLIKPTIFKVYIIRASGYNSS